MALNKAVLALSLVMAVFVVGTITTSILQIIAGQPKETTVVIVKHTPVSQPPQENKVQKEEGKTEEKEEGKTEEKEEGKTEEKEEGKTEEKEEDKSDGRRKGNFRKYGKVQIWHSDYTSGVPSERIADLMSKHRVTPPIKEKVSVTGKKVELPIEKHIGSYFKDVSKPESEMTKFTADGIEPLGNTVVVPIWRSFVTGRMGTTKDITADGIEPFEKTDIVITWRPFGTEGMEATKDITADGIEPFEKTDVVTTFRSFGTERMEATEDGTVTEASMSDDSAATPDGERAHLEDWIAGLAQRLPDVVANMSLGSK